jgi:Holliday junction resolvase
MGMRSRRKGAEGEREAAAELRRLFGIEARRGQQFSGSPESPDVRTDLEKVHFEVKRCESLRLFAAMEQAIRDAGGERIPVVLHRPNGKPWLAIVRLDDLPQLAVALYLALMRKS